MEAEVIGVGFTLIAAERQANRVWHDELPEPDEIWSSFWSAEAELAKEYDQLVTYCRLKGRGRMETRYSREEVQEPIEEFLMKSWDLNAMARRIPRFEVAEKLFE